jgi:hypothetical protein
MALKRIAVICIAVLVLARLGRSQERFAITTHQVAQALADQGIQVSDTQVTLVANVVATDASPKLDVLPGASYGRLKLPDHAEAVTWIKVACHRPGTCLPFYVIVAGMKGQAANASIDSTARLSNLNAQFEPKSEVTMQAGTHATLMLDDHRSRIRVSVVSLEKGTAGSRIRVASPDHKQVYVAEVISSNQLKASF